MEATNPLLGCLHLPQDRIVEDFALASRPPEEHAEILLRIRSLVIRHALSRADRFLTPADNQYIDHILKTATDNETEKGMAAALYIASRVPEFGALIEAAYTEIKARGLDGIDDPNEETFERAEQSADGVGEVLGTANDLAEDAVLEVPGASAFSIGVDLLLDPARFLRSPEQRQRRLFKQAAVLLAKLLGTAWSGLALFTLFGVLRLHHVISSQPSILDKAAPQWFAHQSVGDQMLMLLGSAAGIIVIVLIATLLLARAGAARRLSSAFKMRVDDDELVSTLLHTQLASTFPAGMPPEVSLDACKTIYRSIYLNSGNPNREDLSMLDAILSGGDEKSAAAFLKAKVRRYQAAMQHEVAVFCSKTGSLMGSIG